MVWWTKCLTFKLQDLNPKFSTHIKFWAQWQANAYITSTRRLVSSLVSQSRVSDSPRFSWGILRLAPQEWHLGLTLVYIWTCATHMYTKGQVDVPPCHSYEVLQFERPEPGTCLHWLKTLQGHYILLWDSDHWKQRSKLSSNKNWDYLYSLAVKKARHWVSYSKPWKFLRQLSRTILCYSLCSASWNEVIPQLLKKKK